MSVSIATSEVPAPATVQQDLCLGSKSRLPEFSLAGKVVCVSGAARGLGLTQAEALLEAGAKVYALDRLEEPVSYTPNNLSHHSCLTIPKSPEFWDLQKRAVEELGTEIHYRRIDVRDTGLLNNAIEAIANTEGRLDGLVAAAGIQQETPALEYSAKDANTMFEVNVTGVFMTAQAVAKQMVRFGNGGSIALIASMSGTVANRVRCLCSFSPSTSTFHPHPRNFANLVLFIFPRFFFLHPRIFTSLMSPSTFYPPMTMSIQHSLTNNRVLSAQPTTLAKQPLSN